RGIGVEHDLGDVGDLAHLGGLGSPDDGDGVRPHDAPPTVAVDCSFTGVKSGRTMSSLIGSKVTWRSMSSTSASGVWSQPTMLVVIRGPASSWTTAMEYGAVKPGASRWWMT